MLTVVHPQSLGALAGAPKPCNAEIISAAVNVCLHAGRYNHVRLQAIVETTAGNDAWRPMCSCHLVHPAKPYWP